MKNSMRNILTGLLLLLAFSLAQAEPYYSYLNLQIGDIDKSTNSGTKFGLGVLLGYSFSEYFELETQFSVMGSDYEYSAVYLKPQLPLADNNTYFYLLIGAADIRLDNNASSDSGELTGIGYSSCSKKRSCVSFDIKTISGDKSDATILGTNYSYVF